MSVHDDDIRHVLGQMREAEVDALEPTDFDALRASVEARFDEEGDVLPDEVFAQFDGKEEAPLEIETSTTESSSLFSLDTLSSTEPETESKTTEGSGLLEIQHLASIHQMQTAPPEQNPAHVPQTMAMPAIMPARGSHRSNTPLIVGLAVAVAALGGVGVLGYVVSNKPDASAQPQKVIVEKTIIEKAVPVPAAANASEADKAAEKAKEAAAKAAEPESENPESGSDTPSKKSSRSSKRSSSRRSKPKDSGPAAPSRPSSRKKKKDGIDNLLSNLDNKKSPKKSTPKVAPPPSTKSSSKLSKSQVKGTFTKYNGRLTTCARSSNRGGLKGTVWVSMKIEASGRVSKASIAAKSSKFKSTDIGRCVTKVVRSMKFPSASDPTSFTYPLPVR